MKIPAKKENRHFQQSPRKKGFTTCSLCGRYTDWHCWITQDGGLAYCRYTKNDNGKTDGKGRYEHILKTDYGRNLMTNPQPVKEYKEEVLKADAVTLDAVYCALLERLDLNQAHLSDLSLKRRLKDKTIEENLYKSAPSKNEADEIAQELGEMFDLKGVPGFYVENGNWRFVTNYGGFYIPYRNKLNQIVGLQLRKDDNDKPKYLWVSSNGKDKGTSSGSPVHFIKPQLAELNQSVFITEGALKADIIGEKLNRSVVAIAGVTGVNHQKLVDLIYQTYPHLNEIVIAFDMDWKENEAVKDAMMSLLDALDKKLVSVLIADWDIAYGKGLDDVLTNRNLPEAVSEIVRYVPTQEFIELLTDDESEQVELIGSTESQNIKACEVTKDYKWADDSPETDFILNEEFISEDSAETFGMSWGEFSRIKFEKPERVMFGLSRGNVGQLVASTNVGKTTLMLNLAISACSDKPFEPLLNEQTIGKRVLYIDGEATKTELQADIYKMLESCSDAQRELLKDRLLLICDEDVNDEPLDLANSLHLEKVTEIASKFKPDLIIVDTLSALTNLEDENDNAKVKKEIIQPLKTLAKKTDSAVIILHHTGKYNEGAAQAQDAYKGRGASAFGALCRVVFNLKEQKDGKIVLSCSKVKGECFPSVVMELNQETRWFRKMDGLQIQKVSKAKTNYEQVVNIVRDQFGREIKRSEIEAILERKSIKISVATLTRVLEKAVDCGDLIQPQYGFYAVAVDLHP